MEEDKDLPAASNPKINKQIRSLDKALTALKGKVARTKAAIKVARKKIKESATEPNPEGLLALDTTLAASEKRLAHTKKTIKMVRKQMQELVEEAKEAAATGHIED